jgi:hypothetical protein
MASIHTQSSDYRDRIYALLGLTRDGAEISPLPNYAQSVEDVFKHVATHMILDEGLLPVVLLARNSEMQRTISYAPTWVPDFARRQYRVPKWVKEAILFSCQHRTVDTNVELCADQLLVDGMKLETILETPAGAYPGAVRHDRVQAPHSLVAPKSDSLKVFEHLADTLLQLYRTWIFPAYPKYSKMFAALAASSLAYGLANTLAKLRSACAGDELPPTPDSDEDAYEVFTGFLTDGKDWYEHNMSLQYHGQSLSAWLELYEEKNTDFDGAQLYFGRRTDRLPGKSFVRSPKAIIPINCTFILTLGGIHNHEMKLAVSSRNQLRIVCKDARAGDEVWRVRGCALPVVLRRVVESDNPAAEDRTPTFSFVGEGCHVVRKQPSDWYKVPGFSPKAFKGFKDQAGAGTGHDGPWQRIKLT